MQQNQHYVPRGLLKNFAEQRGEEFYVYAYDKHKDTDNIFRTNITNIAAEKEFYDLELDEKTLSLEPVFCNLEGEATTIIDNLLENKHLKSITTDEKNTLAKFMAVQFVRTKEHRLGIEDTVQQIIEEHRARGVGEDTINNSIKSPSEYDSKRIAIGSVLDADNYVPHFLAKKWSLYETSADHPLYISDNPITRCNKRDLRPYPNLGLAAPGIEIYLPLSTTLLASAKFSGRFYQFCCSSFSRILN